MPSTKKQKSMNKKKDKAEQIGAFWLLSGEGIKGSEIVARLSDIPARFLESIEIMPDTKGGSK